MKFEVFSLHFLLQHLLYTLYIINKFVCSRKLSGMNVLEQYYQEVKNFQETLDAVLAESGTSHIISE